MAGSTKEIWIYTNNRWRKRGEVAPLRLKDSNNNTLRDSNGNYLFCKAVTNNG